MNRTRRTQLLVVLVTRLPYGGVPSLLPGQTSNAALAAVLRSRRFRHFKRKGPPFATGATKREVQNKPDSKRTTGCRARRRTNYTKSRIMGVQMGTSAILPAIFKDGQLHPPAGRVLRFVADAASGGQVFTPLPVGDRVYLVNLQMDIKKDNFTFVVFKCNPCNDAPDPTALRAGVTFQFPKGYLATADVAQIEEVIGQVFAIDNTAGNAQQPLLPVPRQGAQEAPIFGLYVNPQTGMHLQVNPDGSFSLRNAGGGCSVLAASLSMAVRWS